MTEAARRYGLGALAHRNFRLFFIGQGICLVGTWMQNVGEGWLILTLTNSPFYVGLTAALSSFGVLLFSLYAGVIADRVDKRRFIDFMQLAFMIEAFTVSIHVWTHVEPAVSGLVLPTTHRPARRFDVPMLPVFARKVIDRGEVGSGALRSSNGIGAVIGALAVALASAVIQHRGRLMFVGGYAFGLQLILYSVSWRVSLLMVVSGPAAW